MIKNLLISTALVFCVYFTAHSQTDTANCDLGRITVKKDFTQNITVKGSDLQRYQFTNLADAINVWLYGTYSNAQTLFYVINGNIITDVNAYSIYDIDEVTLVQNALAQVSGAPPGAQMVVIKLKTNRPGKQGIEAAGQTGLVNQAIRQQNTGSKSSTNLYNLYYLGGYKNYDDAHFGLSAEYQRDIIPLLTPASFSYQTADPFHFDRFKFNGYADAKLWTGTTVNFGANYVPQTTGSNFSYTNASFDGTISQSYSAAATQHLFSSNIALNSNIAKGLTNTLSAAYSHYNYFENDSLHSVFQYPLDPENYDIDHAASFNRVSNLLIRDYLAYLTKLGIFDLEPVLNFSYRHLRSLSRDSATYISGQLGTGSNTPSTGEGVQAYGGDSKLYLLTPSVNLSYKDMFNFQGGFVEVLNSSRDFVTGFPMNRLSPFLSISADVFKLMNVSDASLQVFASFSRQNQLLDDGYASLAGLGTTAYFVPQGSPIFTTTTGPENGFAISQNNPYHQYNSFQAGFVLKLTKNLSFNYNYTSDYSLDLVQIEVPLDANSSEGVLSPYYDKQTINRIGVNYNFLSKDFNWRTGFNVAEEKVQAVDNAYLIPADNESYFSTGHRYSGGFINRFAYKTFFAGLDVLYQLGERPITLANATPQPLASPPNVNSIVLQNLYFGSRFKITGVKYAEAFVNTRNILQNKSSDITDNRRFFGLGVKVAW